MQRTWLEPTETVEEKQKEDIKRKQAGTKLEVEAAPEDEESCD